MPPHDLYDALAITMTHRALLFTDLIDSTALVERAGDARAAELWAEHDRRARALLAQHSGREIDRADGFFLLFDAADDAAQYAVAYHQAMAELSLSARVGLHVGTVTLRDNDPADVARGAKPIEVEGLAKPFAARIMSLARGGQTLLSAAARSALDALPTGTEIDSHGHYRLKGVEEPVEIFELGTQASAFTPPADADKAYRVVRGGELWRPLRKVRHNLVPERDAFIGRNTELRTLAQQLDAGARLITVLGSGGTGKTRLVRRYGLAWLGDWPGGVYFCDLSEARSLDGIHFAVAFALGVPLGKDDPSVQLGHAIAGRGRCLVILDNFEQVIEHAQATLGRWLDRAGEAAFIVTSRERLHLPGEEILPVEPLALGTEAIELFATRAKAQRPDFVVNELNQAAVAEVVRLLDGLPLAIELAAARVRTMSPSQIALRMKDRFRLLAGARGAAARQATLKAAIDWSWDLLTPWEQAALAQCSVFEGGFTLEAAEAVLDLSSWPAAPPVMDAVQALVDKSLLRAWVPVEHGRFDIGEPYFGMYLSIHEYAAEKLDTGGAAARQQAEQRHGSHFATFGSDEAVDALARHGGVQRQRALALEIDNLVLACRRAVTRGDAGAAVPAFVAAWQVLEKQGPIALGTELGAQVLGIPGLSAAQRAAALLTRAMPSWLSGHMDAAMGFLAEGLSLAHGMGDRRGEAIAMFQLATVQMLQGQVAQAQAHYDAALNIQRELGNRNREGRILAALGNLHESQGRVQLALEHYEAGLAIHRLQGDLASQAFELIGVGAVQLNTGQFAKAREAFDQALELHLECGNRRDAALVLNNLGNWALIQGRVDEAIPFYTRALAMLRDVGVRFYESVVLGNLANVYEEQGQLEQARLQNEEVLSIQREVNNPRSEGITLGNLGQLALVQGRPGQAREFLEQALAKHRMVGNRRFEGLALGMLAAVFIDLGQLPPARQALQQGEALLRDVQDVVELARLLCVRGRAEHLGGNLAQALATLAEAQGIADTTHAEPGSDLARAITKLRSTLT